MKVVLIWDLDGFIGAVNSTSPYNYSYDVHVRELEAVEASLDMFKKYNVKSCYAITGFSAEKGLYPYTFPDLIKRISNDGHEIASHSWKHEWVPLFTPNQVEKSLRRSKNALETITEAKVVGFVPPHNKPVTWLKKGRFSLGDRGLAPFFKMGDLSAVIKMLGQTGYQWIRISKSSRFSRKSPVKPQKVYYSNGILVFENHHVGFGKEIRDFIRTSKDDYLVISAHPNMLNFDDNRGESMANFKTFMEEVTTMDDVQFSTPSEIFSDFRP